MESIRIWRNAQINILRQKGEITAIDQANYFENIIRPLFYEAHPSQILFGYFENDYLIGYGGLVHISWIDKRAEMSFLVDNKRVENGSLYETDLYSFISLMKEICFFELGFNKLFTETYDFRKHHISVLEASGMKEEGRMRQHVFEEGKFIDSILHSILRYEYVR